jgi:hypothetical protein
MNCFKTVMKILTALAAIAGLIYIIATYGDKIVAWAKKLLESCPCKCKVEDCTECECKCDGGCECECEATPAEEAVVEAAPVEEAIEEVVVEENAPVADEADFAE